MTRYRVTLGWIYPDPPASLDAVVAVDSSYDRVAVVADKMMRDMPFDRCVRIHKSRAGRDVVIFAARCGRFPRFQEGQFVYFQGDRATAGALNIDQAVPGTVLHDWRTSQDDRVYVQFDHERRPEVKQRYYLSPGELAMTPRMD